MAKPIELEEGLRTVPVNEAFYIGLWANSSIGYDWRAEYDETAFELMDKKIVCEENIPGSSHQTIWVFRARKPGRHTLRLIKIWYRSLDGAEEEMEQFMIDVI